jgi:hypothetical protein
VIECEYYPLDDPRNDVRTDPDDLTDDSAEEVASRSSRGRSLGVSHQLGRKISKTPGTKQQKIRHTIKVPELDPFDDADLVDRPHELLNIYTFWRDEKLRLDDQYGPLLPPSTQPPALAEETQQTTERENSLSLFVSSAETERIGVDDEQEESAVPKGKKRGRRATTGIKKSVRVKAGDATRKSSRGKGKAPACFEGIDQ